MRPELNRARPCVVEEWGRASCTTGRRVMLVLLVLFVATTTTTLTVALPTTGAAAGTTTGALPATRVISVDGGAAGRSTGRRPTSGVEDECRRCWIGRVGGDVVEIDLLEEKHHASLGECRERLRGLDVGHHGAKPAAETAEQREH